ncbi:MAG: DUF4423 domain-containing protein [Oligoflexia bacterium]|nr:DUF4423 domain-containing protein [Oligoflexia bacterium]
MKVRENILLKKVKAIQQQNLKTEKYISISVIEDQQEQILREYYLNPWHQIVHIALSIERYQQNLNLLALDLNLSMSALQTIVNNLIRMKIIAENNNLFYSVIHNLHLPKENNLFRIWSAGLKLMSINRSSLPTSNTTSNTDSNVTSDFSYDFSVVFSADQNTYLSIKEKFMQFLQTIRPLVEKAPEKNVYQLNFDLFNWTKD